MKRVEDLFDVSYGHSLELNRLKRARSPQGVNFVSRTSKNNGVSARVAQIDGMQPGVAETLTVALGGSVLETFIQPEPYYCGRDVAILTPKNLEMTLNEKLWWALCIRANQYRYNFGRQANRTLKELELPDAPTEWVSTISIPDLTHARDAQTPRSLLPLGQQTWKEYRYDELFEIKKGKRLIKAKRKIGKTPYVGASARNNGITDYIENIPEHPRATMTVAYNGSVGEAFLQPQAFCASDDVNILYTRTEISAAAKLFLCGIIRHERFRYDYGRKWKLERMKKSVMHLPSTSSGEPDWEWMEDYMKSLPYSSLLDVTTAGSSVD